MHTYMYKERVIWYVSPNCRSGQAALGCCGCPAVPLKNCHVHCGLRGLNTGEPAVWGPQLVDQCLAMVIFHGILFEFYVILCEYSWIYVN